MVIVEENVKMLLDSGDEMLIEMANNYIGQPIPSEEDMVETLAFLNVFAIGCKEAKLPQLAAKFNRRADIFAANLVPFGFSKVDCKQYVFDRVLQGSAKRIINKACSRVAYLMCDLKREVDPEAVVRKAEKNRLLKEKQGKEKAKG